MVYNVKSKILSSLSFGLTSGVITTLGMIVGLNSATNSKFAVISGVVILAVSDGFADAFGWHLSEESKLENGKSRYTKKEVWTTTLMIFLSVFGFVLSFVAPLLFFELNTATIASIIWGVLLLVALNIYIAKIEKKSAASVLFEHLLLAFFVVLISYYAGVATDFMLN